MQVNVHEAKTRLSALIQKAEQGEDVIIARDGKPAVRLTPITTQPKKRVFGRLSHLAKYASPDWDSPELDKEIEQMMLDTSKFDWLLKPKKPAAKTAKKKPRR